MTADHAKKPAIAATDFPALRSFLRGYFHQDMNDEYGSAEEAVREFCEDASTEERAAVAREWLRFIDHTKSQPLAEMNRILTRALGSSYALRDGEVQQVTKIFTQQMGKR